VNRDALLAKIKKALALAKSANEHEAAAALATARRLMDEYGVDQAAVELSAVGERSARGSQNERPARWEAILVHAVQRAVAVEPLLDSRRCWTFVGITPGPEIAAYAFTVLYRQLKKTRADYIRTQLKRCSVARKRKRADLFCEGWASVVYQKIAALNPEQPTDDLVRRYLAERHADLGKVSARAAGLSGRIAEDDRARGRAIGRDAQLHQGVAGANPTLLIGQGGARG
jgi:hypothetical protein